MSQIAVGTIAPIKASEIRLPAKPLELFVPIPAPPGVHTPRLISADPIVLAPETIAYAREQALRVFNTMGSLPHTKEAGDLISLALAVLHFTKESA